MRKIPVRAAATLGLLGAVALSASTTSDARAEWIPPYMPDVDLAGPTFADDVAETIPGRIAVDVKDDLSEEEIAALGAEYGITLRDNSPHIKDDAKIELADVSPSEERSILERLSRDRRVEHAERITLVHASFVPNDPRYAEQWHMKKVGAETAWEYACGTGVTVAVIDTGVACYDKGGFMKGTDLAGTSCVGGWNFTGDNDLAADDHGHGTHVAGTIAQTTNNGLGVAGLAHCAKLMPVKVLTKQGYGTMADVAEGIRWAADHGAQVINLSLGSSQKSKIVEDAVTHAYKKGVTVVCAAGNSGRSVGYPAAYKGAIAVSATDKNDNIAWFSSRGPQIAIGAPGVGITQQTVCESGKNKCETFGVFNGTSMASPHVAGAAALVVGMGVTDPDHVLAALQGSATRKEDKNLFGAGVLDARKAVSATHWSHIGLRLVALFGLVGLVLARIRKMNGAVQIGPGAVGGALLGSIGLLPFAPLLGLTARLGSLRPVGEILMRPLGEWDMVLSANLHRWLPLASAAPVAILTALFFGFKPLRTFTGGLALGTAALLAQVALSGDVAFALGPFALRLFAVANILVCAFVARMSLDGKKS